jgi:hypothetical protein
MKGKTTPDYGCTVLFQTLLKALFKKELDKSFP